MKQQLSFRLDEELRPHLAKERNKSDVINLALHAWYASKEEKAGNQSDLLTALIDLLDDSTRWDMDSFQLRLSNGIRKIREQHCK